jgi:hypothetical protein
MEMAPAFGVRRFIAASSKSEGKPVHSKRGAESIAAGGWKPRGKATLANDANPKRR